MSLDQTLNTSKNRRHYDYIADAWQHLLGQNFHWGYFREPDMSLDAATDALIDALVERIDLSAQTHLLDVGCGIGGPARYLAQRHGCAVTGFSTSEEGIARARDYAREAGLEDRLAFEVRNALDSGFETRAFDSVILLEMSHLIRDKGALIAESCRPAKTGGIVSLCDLTLRRKLSAREIVAWQEDIRLMERSFGKARLETLDHYRDLFERCALEEVETVDISEEVIPTIGNWRRNAEENRATLIRHVEEGDVEDFIRSCDILERFYTEGIWGYGIVSGRRTDREPAGLDGAAGRALF